MEMASLCDDAIHEVRRGLRPTSATPCVDWPEDHACGCSGKNEEDGYERWERKDVCEELSVYMLWNVVNKCIKNNQSYDEHLSHNTLPINIIELEGRTRRRSAVHDMCTAVHDIGVCDMVATENSN